MEIKIESGCLGSGAVKLSWLVNVRKNGITETEYRSRLYFFDCPDCKPDEIPDCANCTKRQKRFEKFEEARDSAINSAIYIQDSLRREVEKKKIPAKAPKGTLDVWTSIIDKLYLSDNAHKWRTAIRKVWSPLSQEEKAA